MSAKWQVGQTSLAWSNPLAWWWGLLMLVSATNIAIWFLLYDQLHTPLADYVDRTPGVELMLLLCAAYVFGCAFRSFLPRADIQRICLFDTWLSSVLVGRSVATFAEVCFVAQWAVLLRRLGTMAGADTTLNAAWDRSGARARRRMHLVVGVDRRLFGRRHRKLDMGHRLLRRRNWARPLAAGLRRSGPHRSCHRDRRHRPLSDFSRHHRYTDVCETVAVQSRQSRQASAATARGFA